MKKPVSLAPAGSSLKDLPDRQQLQQPQAAEINIAAQAAEASIEPPLPAVASAISNAVLDFWARQADAFWSHGVTLSHTKSLSQAVEVQGHFVRAQVEMAREQASVWASLMNQTTGLSAVGQLPPVALWAPWQTAVAKASS